MLYLVNSETMQKTFDTILEKVNVESIDNGAEFTVLTRKDNIKTLLNNSIYNVISDTGLSLIYAKKDYTGQAGLILISCHMDSLYTKHFQRKYNSQELLGTFDNSICNAIIIKLMQEDALPSSVLVSFTGDEETKSKETNSKFGGAAETFQYFSKQKRPELVITLDVTDKGYSSEPFTIENYYASINNQTGLRLKFRNNEDFNVYLKAILGNIFLSIENALPDESHYYAKQDVNCFSLCIPTAHHPHVDTNDWMHSDKGILVKEKSISEYSQVLKELVNNIAKNINSE